jgi:hypothetical protein
MQFIKELVPSHIRMIKHELLQHLLACPQAHFYSQAIITYEL